MAANSTAKTPANENTASAGEPAPVDQDALGISELAKGVLARDFRPRIASVRRLAEAVLAKEAKPKKKKKKKPTKKAAAAKSGGKKRKLAKIPGQKGKK